MNEADAAWEQFKQTPEFKHFELWAFYVGGFTENEVRDAFLRGFALGAQTQHVADSVN